MDHIYKILVGATDDRRLLVAGGLFVLVWFAMDAVEFTDFIIQKFNSSPVVCIK